MLSDYKKKKIAQNLRYFFDTATDEDIENGKKWYKKFNAWCTNVANEYKTNNLTVVNVFSILSARNELRKNMLDTITVFEAIKNNTSPDDVKVSTFHRNKYKAFDAAKGLTTIQEDSLKTYAFMQNIAYLNEAYVTVDVWHMRACFDKMIVPKSLTKNIYDIIQDITIKEAKKHGLKGYEYQAIIWESIRTL
jgi:hypothetical protein